jgi:hypothetical protein
LCFGGTGVLFAGVGGGGGVRARARARARGSVCARLVCVYPSLRSEPAPCTTRAHTTTPYTAYTHTRYPLLLPSPAATHAHVRRARTRSRMHVHRVHTHTATQVHRAHKHTATLFCEPRTVPHASTHAAPSPFRVCTRARAHTNQRTHARARTHTHTAWRWASRRSRSTPRCRLRTPGPRPPTPSRPRALPRCLHVSPGLYIA